MTVNLFAWPVKNIFLNRYTVGRLRPHYLTLCKPDYGADGLCKDEWDYNRWPRELGCQSFIVGSRFVVEEEREVCTGLHNGETTPSQLHEARCAGSPSCLSTRCTKDANLTPVLDLCSPAAGFPSCCPKVVTNCLKVVLCQSS